MTNKNNCEARIASHMEGREEDARKLLAAHNGNAEDDTFGEESIYDYPLWIGRYTIIRIDLSTGGPGDWLEAKVDMDGDLVRVDYHFNDWFDHAERPVAEGSSLWQLAAYYVEGMDA